MWRSASESKPVHSRYSRLSQAWRTAKPIQIKSAVSNWFRRRTSHELNSLNSIRLMWSTASEPGLRNSKNKNRSLYSKFESNSQRWKFHLAGHLHEDQKIMFSWRLHTNCLLDPFVQSNFKIKVHWIFTKARSRRLRRNLKSQLHSTVRSTVHTNPSRKRSFLKTFFGEIWKRRLCVLVLAGNILKTPIFKSDDVTKIIWLPCQRFSWT